jgi:hypothetical protein
MAGIRNRKTKGARTNRLSRPAYPKSRILNSNGKTHKNSPLISRNTAITIYPIRELRKLFSSFIKIAIIIIDVLKAKQN